MRQHRAKTQPGQMAELVRRHSESQGDGHPLKLKPQPAEPHKRDAGVSREDSVGPVARADGGDKALGAADPVVRLIGGEEVTQTNHPWQQGGEED